MHVSPAMKRESRQEIAEARQKAAARRRRNARQVA